jgi:murein DD-endopeptidase MepM/ murein hydrolase activator NlpD
LIGPLLLALVLAAPSALVTPPVARPGDAVLVAVQDADTLPSGSLAGRPLRFWPAGERRWLAVAPLPIEALPGRAAVEVSADGLPLAPPLELGPPGFASTTLSVPPKFLEPPPAARRRMALDQVALKKAWDQPFVPPRLGGPLVVPLDVEPSSRYGDQRVYNGKTEGVHYGLDLPGATGDPVGAAGDGEVVLARDCYMSGNTVILWHGAGLFTAYFHLSRMEVKAGDRVERGRRIGRVGSTGRSTGPHLHWGVKVDGLWVDPRSATRLDLAAGDVTAPPASLARPPPSADGAAALPR